MIQTRTKLGELDCRVVQADDADIEQLAILCHGFGAPGDDLVPIGAEVLETKAVSNTRFIFPAAPVSLAPLGYGAGRAWWLLDMDRLALAQSHPGEASVRLREETPAGLPTARRMLMSLIDEASRQAKLPLSRILLGGFSQGAMLATDVALRLEEAPKALMIFSGALINESDWKRRAPTRKGLRVFQSHGRQDPLLPFQNAEALRDLLQDAGLAVTFAPFDGPHTIPLEGIEALASELNR